MTTPDIHPLTRERWEDFADLCRQMGPNRSCWCIWWRENPGERRTLTRRHEAEMLAGREPAPGLLAYVRDEPIGWVAVAERGEYSRLARGRDTAPVDDRPGLWAVPCFFVRADHRNGGVTAARLRAAVKFASEHGAVAIEGFPIDPSTRSRSASASYTSVLSTFAAGGFHEMARRTPKGRVIVRRDLSG
jgi:GNAT superfamily N-acetyltransferase